MMHKQPKPPNTQRSFANSWGELDYLCQKIRFWLYTRKQKTRAERYLDRLARILRELPENDAAIIREEGLALFHELQGELGSAIAHREREIRLTERLHKEAQSPRYAAGTRSYMLRNREAVDLQERRAILETLKKEQTRRQPVVRGRGLNPQVNAG
jgi:hypothetical protein